MGCVWWFLSELCYGRERRERGERGGKGVRGGKEERGGKGMREMARE